MTQSLKFWNEFLIVVYFPVKNNDYRTVFIEERLLPSSNVNDSQSSVTQGKTRLVMFPGSIWPPMGLRVIHTPQEGAIQLTTVRHREHSSDSTHQEILFNSDS
jgi:hypothetical protein